MKVLIIKLTSMGDLIHALPAITDAVKAYPDIQFDWVVDEAFKDITQLHPAIKQTITSKHRRWAKDKWKALVKGDLKRFWQALRTKQYDIVLDAQNNHKSALVTRLARGLRCGMDKNSVREFAAHFAYQKTFSIPPTKATHAVDRQRLLFAKALGYELPHTAPDFGIDRNRLMPVQIDLPDNYLVFIHNTSWESKHWPESYWIELIKLANNQGFHVVLPWGSREEHERALRMAKTSNQTTVLPRLRILEQGSLLLNARGVIAVDTGLAHLAAALEKPTVHLYSSTEVKLLGIQNEKQKFLSATYDCAPCYLRTCQFGKDAKCFMDKLPPATVWKNFTEHLQSVTS